MSATRKAEEADNDFEVEVVEDVAAEDRGRPLAPEATDSDDDISVNDDEISNYRDEWKKRLKELSFKTHSERRAKEYAAKERDEAIRLAERLAEENKKYRELAGNTEQFAANQAKARAEGDIAATKRLMKEAFESGETEKFLDYQEQLQRFVNEHERYANYRPVRVPEPTYEIPKPRPQPDTKVVDWANKNPWFEGQNELEKEMTGYAYAVSDVLIRDSKIDPRSDRYFEELNTRIARRFPEYFQKSEPEIDVTAKTSSVVAPATRTAKTTRTVRLTPSQVSVARRLGLTPEQYYAQYKKDYGHG
jgi:predicted DNA binding CopG/RHH family protein